MRNMELIFGCLHSPFHNKELWYGILNLIKDLPIKGVSLIGDILDINSLCFQERGKIPLSINGLPLNLRTEYQSTDIFDELDAVCGKKIKKRFLYGNHENRYLRAAQHPDSYKLIVEPPEEHFRLRERGYEVKTEWKEDYFLLGDHLQVFHGELLGVNPAKRQLDKLKHSCMFAHSHRAGTHHDGLMVAYNIGWLGDRYSPVFKYEGRLTKRNWIDGFGLVTIDDDGDFYANIITAHNNRFYYNGKRYGSSYKETPICKT